MKTKIEQCQQEIIQCCKAMAIDGEPVDVVDIKYIFAKHFSPQPSSGLEGIATPRTDKLEYEQECNFDVCWEDHARQLERELHKVTAEREEAIKEVVEVKLKCSGVLDIARERDELRRIVEHHQPELCVETRLERDELKQQLTKWQELEKPMRGLVEIVEGVRNSRWHAQGLRLKDTNEWCAFYWAMARLDDARRGMGRKDAGNRKGGGKAGDI